MLNEEVLDSLQRVNVNLVFYGDNITFSVQRDKPIDLIYRSAYDYFKIHGKAKLYYKNKELTPYLNYTIGKYFKKLKNIDILVKDSSRMDNTFDYQLLLNSNYNLERLNKINLNNDNQIDKNIENPIQNKNKNNLTQNQRSMTFCWDCKKFPINIFCRDCCAFICKYCRMDLENAHYSHRTVTLYPENLAKSANLYKTILLADLNEVEKINMNINKFNEKNKEININIDEKKNHLMIKINRLIDKINQIKSYQKEINYYIKNKDKCKQKINESIKEINTTTNEYLKKYENDDDNNSKGINSNKNSKDLKEIFSKMNAIEKRTGKICKVGKTIQEWEEINLKLENALKSLENRIYNIIEEAAEGEDLNYENTNKKNIEDSNINKNMIKDEENMTKEDGDKNKNIVQDNNTNNLQLKNQNDDNINENKDENDKNSEKKESENKEKYENEKSEAIDKNE